MREFHELFAGRGDAYGTYAVSSAKREKGAKRTGRAKTLTDANLTKGVYQKHVDGKVGLGVVPIRLDGTVSWFAIDVDVYTNDNLHVSLAKKINKLNLPLVICTTKSGGAHLFCFLTQPADAKEVREHADKYVAALGLPKKTEIFPKQDLLEKDMAGSWINLPYFGDERPCMGVDGDTPLTLKEFYFLAAEREVHPSDLGFRTKELDHHETEDTADGGMPPCIVAMVSEGIEEGGRDNALTHIAVYLKRAFPDDWQEMIFDWNETHCHPSISPHEIMRIVKSAERKDYQYLCKQSPMVGLCDKSTCLKRKFGIGDGEGDFANFNIDNLRKVGDEDPYYVIVVDGLPIKLTTDELLSFPKFRKAVFERLNKLIGNMKPAQWEKRISEQMATMEIQDAPDEVSTSGGIMSLFMAWTSQRIRGKSVSRDRVADGQPHYDGNHIFFRGTDFLGYVRRNGTNRNVNDRLVWLTLSEEGAEQEKLDIKGRELKVWKFPVGEAWFDVEDNNDGAF